eukprot:CAMPEP_0198489682 /NCGR_PEP_ID=MMETSP1462-20131121/1646_1 /TAXON_ID=1333877 /ORGANISM="Brandtodinium nutriculum, Strain RCC3387" /LENGTH=51 /DNA_ID=CAMNT_0044218193 /DNA_START=240 /DNA_END=395 /DNA_ORIENTATION=+
MRATTGAAAHATITIGDIWCSTLKPTNACAMKVIAMGATRAAATTAISRCI